MTTLFMLVKYHLIHRFLDELRRIQGTVHTVRNIFIYVHGFTHSEIQMLMQQSSHDA